MIQAKLQTTNFEFCAYGDDHSDAMASLLLGLHEHGKQYGLPSDWFSTYEGDIYTTEIKMGSAYRDNELIKPRKVQA